MQSMCSRSVLKIAALYWTINERYHLDDDQIAVHKFILKNCYAIASNY